MEMKIVSQKKNPFLEREEFVLEIKNKLAPPFDEVRAEFGKDVDLTVVRRVNTTFGRQFFVADVIVYDSIEAKNKVEVIPKKIKKKLEADRKAEEEAAKKAEEAAKKAEEEAKKAEEEAKKAEEIKPEEETE